jgi:SAM-dependent methyltransferase
MKQTWFANWFDTEYYHILYGNKRSDEEALLFIQSLQVYFEFEKGLSAWDMSCGKGRHARALQEEGFMVTATDISHQSIRKAQEIGPENIHYSIHDMRKFFRSNYFDFVGNFFTSIGYFKSRYQDERILRNAFIALKPKGVFVLDFFNASKLLNLESSTEVKQINGIEFLVRKYVTNNAIHKAIIVSDNGKRLQHEEKVNLYSLDDLSLLLKKSGFTRFESFGNYKLDSYSKDSERCILVAVK